MNFEKFKDMFIKNFKWIILFISIICFLLIAEDVFTHEIMKCDVIGYDLISKYIISDNLTKFMKFITSFGGVYILIILTLILIIFIKNKKVKISVVANLTIITILNQALKFILQRPRPDEYRIINETGYSFPSGHSMISMAFYGFMIYLIYNHINNKYLKWILISILSILIFLIGFSRIYLGVHYVSDVLAGFIISIGYLILFTSIVFGGKDEKQKIN